MELASKPQVSKIEFQTACRNKYSRKSSEPGVRLARDGSWPLHRLDCWSLRAARPPLCPSSAPLRLHFSYGTRETRKPMERLPRSVGAAPLRNTDRQRRPKTYASSCAPFWTFAIVVATQTTLVFPPGPTGVTAPIDLADWAVRRSGRKLVVTHHPVDLLASLGSRKEGELSIRGLNPARWFAAVVLIIEILTKPHSIFHNDRDDPTSFTWPRTHKANSHLSYLMTIQRGPEESSVWLIFNRTVLVRLAKHFCRKISNPNQYGRD